MKTQAFHLNEQLQWQDLSNGVQRQVLGYNDAMMMVKVKFEKGAVGAMHSHPHIQASYIESGAFETLIGDVKKVLKAGDAYFVLPDIQHGVLCLEAGILIDVFTPMRQDFLHKEH